MMAEGNTKSDDNVMCCASCGTAEGGGIELKKCNGCHLVRYCGVKCQREHRPQHKRECKKRAAELRDEILFKQPESSHLGDCPICCLPLSLDPQTCTITPCCCKMYCNGCSYAKWKREFVGRLEQTCPFCRHPARLSKEERRRIIMKRVEANDPVALCNEGLVRNKEGDYKSAFEYWTKAASLGNTNAHHYLSVMYLKAQGVEKDDKKMIYHAEEAAIGGHVDARATLAQAASYRLPLGRSIKHAIIAAKQGHDFSLNVLKDSFKLGLVTKEDLTAALRGHQAAIDATKSPQREAAKAAKQHSWQNGPVFL